MEYNEEKYEDILYPILCKLCDLSFIIATWLFIIYLPFLSPLAICDTKLPGA